MEDRNLTLKRDLWGFTLGLISTAAFYGAYGWIVLTTVAGAAFWMVPWEELTGEKPALGETGDSPGAP